VSQEPAAVQEDGEDNYIELQNTAGCQTKADVQCVYQQKIAPPEGTVPRHMPKRSPSSCGDAADCEAELTPRLSLAQSLIGGAVTARGGVKRIRQVLVAGLGAGAVPRWFAQYLPESSLVEAIDSSAGVVAAAPCFGLHPGKKLRVVHTSAREHLKSCQNGTYDVVILDDFLTASPEKKCLSTSAFFNQVRSKLTTKGSLLVNVAPDDAELVASAMKQAFGNVERGYAPGLGNVILRSQERPRPQPEALPEAGDDDNPYGLALLASSQQSSSSHRRWPQGRGWGGSGLAQPKNINLAEDKAVEWASAANFELLELPEDTVDEDGKRDARAAREAAC